MKSSREAPLLGPTPANPRGLAVLVACHHLVCAIPTDRILRLTLPEDATEIARGVLAVGRERFAIWDLGERLGLAPTRLAWCLLRIPSASGSGDVALALATGRCRVVIPRPVRLPLPAALFTGPRGAAIAGVFVVGDAECGFELDVDRLWTPAELASSEALLRSAGN